MKHIIKLSVVLLSAFSVFFLTGCGEGDTIYEGAEVATVKINAEAPSSDNVGITITPNAHAARVVYAIGLTEDHDAFLAGTLESRGAEGNSEFTDTFDNLSAYTSYVIYAQAYDGSGSAGPLATLTINTLAQDEFRIESKFISDLSAAFYLTCDTTFSNFTYALGKSEDKDAFIAGTLDGIVTYRDTKYYVPTFFDLSESTDYVLFVSANDRQGNSYYYETPFTTESSSSVPSVTMSADPNNDIYKETISVTCNSNVGKVEILTYNTSGGYTAGYHTFPSRQVAWADEFAVCNGDIFMAMEGFTNDEGKWKLTPYSDALTTITATTDITYYRSGLYTDVEYVVYALVYDNSLQPYSVVRLNYSSPVYDYSLGTPSATYSYIVNTSSVDLSVTAGSNTDFVLYGILPQSSVDGISDSSLQIALLNYGRLAYINDTGTSFSDVITSTAASFAAALVSGTTYYLLIQPSNGNGYGYFLNGYGQMTGFSALIKESFTL